MSVAAHMAHPAPVRKFSVIALEKLAGADSDDSGSSATEDTPSPTEFSEMGEMEADYTGETSPYSFHSTSFDNPSISWKPAYSTDAINFDPESVELANALQSLSGPTTEGLTDTPILFSEALGPYGYPVIPWEEYLGDGYHNHDDVPNSWELGSQQSISSIPAPLPPSMPSHPILAPPTTTAFKDIDFLSSGNMDWLLSLTGQPNSSEFPVSRYQSDLFPVPTTMPVGQSTAALDFRSVPATFNQHANSNSNATATAQQSPQSQNFPAMNMPAFHTHPQTPPATPKYDMLSEAYDSTSANAANDDDDNKRYSMWSDYFSESNQQSEMIKHPEDGTLSPGWRDAGSCVEAAGLSISPPQYDQSNLPEFSPFYFGDGHDGFPCLPPMPQYPISWAE